MRYPAPMADLMSWAKRLVLQLERDYSELLHKSLPYAEMHISSSAATTISVQGTYVKAAGTTTLDDATTNFVMPSNNRLTWIGTATEEFLVNCSVSATSASNNQIVGIALARNGTVSTFIRGRFLKGAAADIDTASFTGLIELATNDYIEVFVTNESSATTVTLSNMNLTVVGLNR